MSDQIKSDRDRWVFRRLAVFATLAFIGCQVTYIIAFGQDTALLRETASMLIMLAGAVIMTYIGAPVVEYIAQQKAALAERRGQS